MARRPLEWTDKEMDDFYRSMKDFSKSNRNIPIQRNRYSYTPNWTWGRSNEGGTGGFQIPDFGFQQYVSVDPKVTNASGFKGNMWFLAGGTPRNARFGKSAATLGLVDQALSGDPLGALLTAPIDLGLAVGANRLTTGLTTGMMASPNPYVKIAGGALRLLAPATAVGALQSAKRQVLNPGQGGTTGMTALAAGALPAGANSGGLGGIFADIPFIGRRYQQKKQAAVDIDIAKQAQQAALETQDPFLQKQLQREVVAKQALLNTQGQLAQQITKMTGMMSLYDRAMSEQGSTRRTRIQYDPRYKAILDPSSL